jgi:Mitochondrial ribosomal protein (VAR1)
MKNTPKNLNFSKQIQKLNLSIKEQKMFNKSQKKNLFIYVKGLKIFYYLNLQFISKWNNISKNLFNVILPKNEQIIKKINNNNNKILLLEKKNQEIKNENNLNNKNILGNNKLIKTNNFNILKESSYNLLIDNKIAKEKLDLYQSSDNLNNFKLIFKGQPLQEIISNNSINKKSTREYINSITKFDSNNAYSYTNNYNYKFFVNNNKIPKNIYTFLEYSFLSLSYLISKPFFEITPDKIVIHLFYFQIKPKKKIIFYKDNINQLLKKKIIYYKDNISILSKKINRIKLYIISKILRKFFKKSVELEIVRLHYPYHNTNIFVNLLGKMVNKIKLRRILRRFFNNAKIFNPTKMITNKVSKIPSFISGVKIKIAGRLLTQRVIPRKTVKTISKGSLARGKIIFLEKGRFTNKNKRGAFSITVTTGHIKI